MIILFQIAPQTISEDLKSNIFLGGMPPDPPSWHTSHATASFCTPIVKLIMMATTNPVIVACWICPWSEKRNSGGRNGRLCASSKWPLLNSDGRQHGLQACYMTTSHMSLPIPRLSLICPNKAHIKIKAPKCKTLGACVAWQVMVS